MHFNSIGVVLWKLLEKENISSWQDHSEFVHENISTPNGMKYLDKKIDFGHTEKMVSMKYSWRNDSHTRRSKKEL